MPEDRLSSTFSALSDPTRRAILARLALGEASVKELAAPFDMSLPAVSKHLKVLERAGLVSRGEGRPFRDVAEWLESYRRFWQESISRLEQYLEEVQASEAAKKTAAHPRDKRDRKVKE
jgi:DNA-binding transcriptional ArsR family regulator